MIRHLSIDNFKSLVDFSLPGAQDKLPKFVCLIGLNGSGKSTLLQAFDFLAQLMSGRMSDWLESREWKKSDLTSRLLKRQLISFRVVFYFPEFGDVEWSGVFNTSLLVCTSEVVMVNGSVKYSLKSEVLAASDAIQKKLDLESVGVSYSGSIFSVFEFGEGSAPARIKSFMQGVKSLELLSPQLMRKRAKQADDVGTGGEKLSAFLHGLSADKKQRLEELIVRFYPHVKGLRIQTLKAGWKNLVVQEDYPGAGQKLLETDARHLNDGMLRIFTVLAQTLAPHPFLMFDEIENGINPELIGRLVETLLEVKQQVIVTTHSPMILNFLPDEVARESVILLYKTPKGVTKAVRFFDLPEPSKKLEILGPGEVFVDTYLEEVVRSLGEQELPQ